MALGTHSSWSDAGQNGGHGSGGRSEVLRHLGLASAVLLSGCTALGALGLNTGSPTVPPRPVVAMPHNALPKVVSVTPPSPPEVASVQPPMMLLLPPAPRPRPRPPAPKPPEETPTPGPPSPPKIVIGDLLGSDFTGVLHVFRSPDSVNNDNLSVVWTYAPPGCTLRLFFYPDIKTTVFHLLKYDFRDSLGDMLMPGDACMDSMLSAGFRAAAPQ